MISMSLQLLCMHFPRSHQFYSFESSGQVGLVKPPLAPGGSLSSDTESDEPTRDVPSPASDFGLDRMLGRLTYLSQFFLL